MSYAMTRVLTKSYSQNRMQLLLRNVELSSVCFL